MSVTAQLARDPLFQGKKDILVVDPSPKHYYQPLWTFVGAGLKSFKDSERSMADLIPTEVSFGSLIHILCLFLMLWRRHMYRLNCYRRVYSK